MENYKVALITNIPTPYRISLFEKLAKHPSISLYVYFNAITEKNRVWRIALDHRFKYKILPGYNITYQGWAPSTYHINPSIINELTSSNYDAVISGGYDSFTNQVSFLLCKIKKIPFILWSGSTINERNLMRRITLPLIKYIVRHSDSFIAYGTKAKEYLISLGAHHKDIFIAYNTVDTNFFMQQCLFLKNNKNKILYEIGLQNKKIVLYIGQLIKCKDLKTLIKAYSKLKQELDAALLIIGDGPLKNDLENYCVKENVYDVYFIGFKPKKELPKYYVISDLFVLPSINEIWGLVLNEAMSCGLPVITTDKVGASVDLIQNGVNGIIVESKNVEQLYLAMKKILNSPKLIKSMGKKSRQLVEENFRLDHAVNGFISAINYAVNKK